MIGLKYAKTEAWGKDSRAWCQVDMRGAVPDHCNSQIVDQPRINWINKLHWCCLSNVTVSSSRTKTCKTDLTHKILHRAPPPSHLPSCLPYVFFSHMSLVLFFLSHEPGTFFFSHMSLVLFFLKWAWYFFFLSHEPGTFFFLKWAWYFFFLKWAWYFFFSHMSLVLFFFSNEPVIFFSLLTWAALKVERG